MTRVLLAFAAVVLAGVPVAASAAPRLAVTYAESPYTFAATCNLSQPLVFINVVLRNRGNEPSGAISLGANDDAGVLAGTVPVPSIDPGNVVSLRIPLLRMPSSAGAIGGPHLITVVLGDRRLKPLLVPVPETLCAPGTPVPVPSSGGAAASATVEATSKRARVTQAPGYEQTATAINPAHSAMIASLKVGAPSNLRAAIGAPDCGAHVGLLGALACPDMIKSGDLLLIWDWQAGAGPDDIDGYRVYRVDGGLKQLVYTQANKKDLTLVDVAKPPNGYAGKCYAVSAYVGARESEPSSAFCAGGGSAATTSQLRPVQQRSSHRSFGSTGGPFERSPLLVGFAYIAIKRPLGDQRFVYLNRAAVAFDVSALRDRRLVSAKLRMTISMSSGAGNNHSCATDVGTGTEFWWQNDAWIDGQFGFGIAPTDVGPEISADVTPIVATWLHGEPNYGFVVKNADENFDAFTNKQCETAYANPILEITYY